MTANAYFITGTDTGVGKTYISTQLALQALAQGKRIGYYKPIQTGVPFGLPPEDPDWVLKASQGQVSVFNRYCFEPPVAPAAADPEGCISIDQIVADVAQYREQFDVLLVEGAGGVMVPVSPTVLMLDVMQQLALPVVLVARSGLGTINHTLLSVQAIQQRGLTLDRIIFNQYPPEPITDVAIQTLMETIQPHLPEDCLLQTVYDDAGVCAV